MKVITLKQPWASLIVKGDKKYEFRSWKTNYRGEVLIHAGYGENKEAKAELKEYLDEPIPRGMIIGKVTITDCIKVDEEFLIQLQKQNSQIYNKKYIDNYAWKIENPIVLEKPIPAKGKLSFWEYKLDEKHN